MWWIRKDKNNREAMKDKDKSENEIIAEFMGYSQETQRNDAWCRDFEWNWSSLMPVVEKIESLGFAAIIMCDSCCINRTYNRLTKNYSQINALEETKIKATYKAVVEFIKWYNQNVRDNG